MQRLKLNVGVVVLGCCWPFAALAQPPPQPSAQPSARPSARPSAQPSAQPAAAPSDAPSADGAADREKEAAYGQHMDNGLKLYSEGHYDPAVAEFEAAYAIRPNASPLINIALCYKRQARYAEAIAVLERAQRDHQDTMKPEHRAAVDREIKDMRALLAYLNVKVDPPEARLLVDDRLVEAGWRDKPLALAPGSHIVRAEAEGYKSAQVVVRLVSGNDNTPVTLKLKASLGRLTVRPSQPDAEVSIDGAVVGRGSFSGLRNAGVHQVTVKHGDGSVSIRILVSVGGTAVVEQVEGGALRSDAVDTAPSVPGPPQPQDEHHRFFATGHFGLLTAVAVPDNFTIGKDRTGFGVGGSLGYLGLPWLGIELMAQYSDIRITGDFTEIEVDRDETINDGSYRLQTFRGAAMLRFNLPPATVSKVRFAGAIGGGMVLDRVTWEVPEDPDGKLTGGPFPSDASFEVFPYGQLDLGIEVEIDQFMGALVLQQSLHSTKHLADSPDNNPFGERPQLVIGPFLRAGYAF